MKQPKYSPDFTHEAVLKGRICGVDEAGRGPLAGPVIAAAVILNPDCIPAGLNDSKALSPLRRERLLNEIMTCAEVGIGICEPEEIDRRNILWASMTAMERAVDALGKDICNRVDHALIDGNRVPRNLSCCATALIKGDARSVSIAAASIVAKVTRDKIMVEADARFPGYGFANHKGYTTKEHTAALARLGPCPIHRRSYAPVQKGWRLL